MRAPNHQLEYARDCVSAAEQAIWLAMGVVAERLFNGVSVVKEEGLLLVLYTELEASRAMLADAEARSLSWLH